MISKIKEKLKKYGINSFEELLQLFFGLIVFAAIIAGIAHSCTNPGTNTPQTVSKAPVNKHLIIKSNFNGEWAFKADSVELYCEKINDNITGVKVTINGNAYAITRNLEHKYTFLPYAEWADAKMEGLLCEGVYMDKQCKVYLTDTVDFADTLCD